MFKFYRLMVVCFGIAAAPVMAQDVGVTEKEIADAAACDSARGLEDGDTLLCHCAPDAMSGSVWGTAAYTSDSSVCAAARHAGAVSPSGGAVILTGVAGRENYSGSEQNGITTRDWGSYGSSFTVTAATVLTALPQCGVLTTGLERLTCQCPEGSGNSGRVWGYGPYTADSDICSAARHAGIVGPDGGAVTVLRVQGLESYVGAPSNGVETSDWSSYDSSIVFDWNAD